jgi:hypothetical protein
MLVVMALPATVVGPVISGRATRTGYRQRGSRQHFSEGYTARPLMGGAASSLLRTDGTADVGAWNREVRMEPYVVPSGGVSGAYFQPTSDGPLHGSGGFLAERVAQEHYLSPSSREGYAWYARARYGAISG